VKRLREWLNGDETFLLTYGDGVADVNLRGLIDFHAAHGKLATMTSVRSPARFGRLGFDGNQVTEFFEKPETGEGWINGGFFVLNTKALDYIEGDDIPWERDPVERLAHDGQLMGFKHYGFWSCMDTLREKNYLDEMWRSGKAPWKMW
jgi:glucose-1-phosphate cytidylyltransferase